MTLPLTTIARVKELIGELTTDQDVVLTRLIVSVSNAIETELHRYVGAGEYIETIPVWPGNHVFSVKAIPVATSPAPILKMNSYRDFSGAIAQVEGQDYIVEYDTGLVRLLPSIIGIQDRGSGYAIAPTYVRITYTGGMAATTADVIATQPEIAMMADLQVAYLLKRRNTPGGNMTVGPNSTAFDRAYDWLPSVKRTLEMYKRRGIY